MKFDIKTYFNFGYVINDLKQMNWTEVSTEDLRKLKKSLNDSYYVAHGDIKTKIGEVESEVKFELIRRWELNK